MGDGGCLNGGGVGCFRVGEVTLTGPSGSLIAVRSAQAFQDRFSDPDATSSPTLYGWKEENRLVALALAQVGKMSQVEAVILDVIDLVWLDPEGRSPATALLAALKSHGRRISASRLRLSIVTDATGEIAQGVPGGHVRTNHVHSHARVSGIGRRSWDPTPFDGDYGFFLRPPPSTQARGLHPNQPDPAARFVRVEADIASLEKSLED